LSAPKTGRNIKAIIPDASITGGTVNRGGGLFLTINGLKDGLRPKATYSVTLRNDGTTLGTITTDSSGNIENTVTIPSNASVGNQILDVTGTNVAGQDIDVTTTVYVATGTNDSDGDSIADRQDSCPLMINSGQDADQDGIDDACDGAMLPTGNGLTPTDPGSASSTATSNTPPQTTGTTAPAPGNTNNSTYITSGFMTTASINPSIAATQQSQNLRVLGSATTIPASTRLNINNHLLNTKDNLPTIHWLPWGIDVALFGLLLTLLNWLGNKRAVSR
jgi:hypothetical protein